MKPLAVFIKEHQEDILREWEAFARTISADGKSVEELRNDASRMLAAIGRDMDESQTDADQLLKSQGLKETDPQSAAYDHGTQRFGHGFTMGQMVSEYRALRATVMRLWARENGAPMEAVTQELVRFNEGLDQAIAESVSRFTQEVDHYRDLFLAMLGHDLRTPLGTIVLTADALAMNDAGPPSVREGGERIARNARQIERIAHDLLDFTRTKMGGPLPLSITDVDLADLAQAVVQQVQVIHPGQPIVCVAEPRTVVQGDDGRLRQAVSNLLTNACEHGREGRPVTVSVTGDSADARVAVTSSSVIEAGRVKQLFEPWVTNGATRNFGLGLYIVQQVAVAHRGEITVSSGSAAGTTFTLRVPLVHA